MAGTGEQGRVEPPLAGDEASSLLGFLDYELRRRPGREVVWMIPIWRQPLPLRR
jgi:hypothetical protein